MHFMRIFDLNAVVFSGKACDIHRTGKNGINRGNRLGFFSFFIKNSQVRLTGYLRLRVWRRRDKLNLTTEQDEGEQATDDIEKGRSIA